MPEQRSAKVVHMDMHLARKDADAVVGRFTPAEDLPEESLEIRIPARIRERREKARRDREEKRSFRRTILGTVAVVATGLTLMHFNSRSAETAPGGIPVKVGEGENITTAIERHYRDTHNGQEADKGYVATQAGFVVERQQGGSSLVHEGDVFYIEPAD